MFEFLTTQSLTLFIMNYAYLGAFVLGFISSVSIFAPMPSFIVIFSVAPFWDPLLLGFAAGLGAAFGEISGYLSGWAGEAVLLRKYEKQLDKTEKLFDRYHPFWVILFFSATPLPFDFVGIFCGVITYPFKKFFVPLVIGKIIKYWVIAFAGFYGLTWIMNYMVF